MPDRHDGSETWSEERTSKRDDSSNRKRAFQALHKDVKPESSGSKTKGTQTQKVNGQS